MMMEGGGRELLACGLVHHRSEAISCNTQQLTQDLRLMSRGGILPLRPTHENVNTNTCVNDFYGIIWLIIENIFQTTGGCFVSTCSQNKFKNVQFVSSSLSASYCDLT